MQKLVALALGGGLVVTIHALAACSSSSSNDDSATMQASDADGAANDLSPTNSAPADGGEADGASDAASDAPNEDSGDLVLHAGEGLSVENARTPKSCSAVCAAQGFACGNTTCSTIPGMLGLADYLGGNTTPVDSCSDVPAATNGAESFVRVDCCCVVPYVLFTGPTPSKSCNTVCTSHSLKCDDTHDWGDAGKGGVDIQYERPSTTEVTDYSYACTKVPTATIPLTKPTEDGTLSHYTCACVGP